MTTPLKMAVTLVVVEMVASIGPLKATLPTDKVSSSAVTPPGATSIATCRKVEASPLVAGTQPGPSGLFASNGYVDLAFGQNRYLCNNKLSLVYCS